MPRRKTVKFTYEGSSKPIKLIYIIGRTFLSIGSILFIGWIIYTGLVFWNGYVEQNVTSDLIVEQTLLAVIPISFGIIGRSIVSIAQFFNWWDRGSVNSKIFRK